ncbi:hypothetical protein FE249_07085 [Acidiphilium multivorum]|nr:hypothetical protein FE249_07085 [Acidiphilium multivorum]
MPTLRNGSSGLFRKSAVSRNKRAQRRIEPADIIAWLCWRCTHQAAPRRAHQNLKCDRNASFNSDHSLGAGHFIPSASGHSSCFTKLLCRIRTFADSGS